MKRTAATLALVATLLGAMVAETASAHGGGYHHGGPRVSVGVGFGFGPYWPGYWPGYWGAPYPYYPAYGYSPYYPQVVTTPPTYIERGDTQAAPHDGPRDSWWYYCPEAKAYYPYVKQCAGGWQKVAPEPQAEAR